jgi:hypothetical protein
VKVEAVSKMKSKIITIEGASKSSTDKSQLVSTMVEKTVGYVSQTIDSSIGKKLVFEELFEATIARGPVLFVAKSLGAIRLCQYFRHIRYVCGIAPWKAVLIDPHAPFPILYGALRPFKFDLDLSADVENFYQRNGYPRGALVKGAKNTQIIEYRKDINHFTIVNHPIIGCAIKRAYNALLDIESFSIVIKDDIFNDFHIDKHLSIKKDIK